MKSYIHNAAIGGIHIGGLHKIAGIITENEHTCLLGHMFKFLL